LFIIFPTTGTLQTNNGGKKVYRSQASDHSAGGERVCGAMRLSHTTDGYVALANAAGSATALSDLNARKLTLRR
jgi:hypothetical protein